MPLPTLQPSPSREKGPLFEGIKKLDRILILGTAETNCKAACGEG
jgi:hypothetical protein